MQSQKSIFSRQGYLARQVRSGLPTTEQPGFASARAALLLLLLLLFLLLLLLLLLLWGESLCLKAGAGEYNAEKIICRRGPENTTYTYNYIHTLLLLLAIVPDSSGLG